MTDGLAAFERGFGVVDLCYDARMETDETELLKRYSEARISAIELRRALGGITFGDVLAELAKRDLPLRARQKLAVSNE
ncbi:MAG TPA: hypothetical protein VIZ17_15310 [Acetobacteraceae bacterium]